MNEKNPVVYIGYTIEDWSEIFQIMYMYDETATIAEYIMDDMADQLQDGESQQPEPLTGKALMRAAQWINRLTARPGNTPDNAEGA